VKSKKRQTMAKLTRERLVKERRALKREKKQAAAAARNAEATNGTSSTDVPGDASVAVADDAPQPVSPTLES
jgi:hypothetical protein